MKSKAFVCDTKRIAILYLFIVLLNSCSYRPPKDDYLHQYSLLQKNVGDYFLSRLVNERQIEEILLDLSDEGFWPQIDYTSKQRGLWPPIRHVKNLLSLAKAYNNSKTARYHSELLLAKFNSAFNFWVENDFQSYNWWYNEIGVPKLLAPTMILMHEKLSDDQKKLGEVILGRSQIGMTGQNKIWQSGNVLLKSILIQDHNSTTEAIEAIQNELAVKQGEGIQADWSFHQHGAQLQLGSYGLSYAEDMIKWTTILQNTPYEMRTSNLSILRAYLLDGLQWVAWKGQMDISACGRKLFIDSPQRKAKRLGSYFKKMEQIDSASAQKFRNARNYQYLVGNKHFWRSDYQVQRNREYYFSVKMCSERVIGAESLNGENKQGYYMGDGATFIYLTGKEYQNIFPFWDWTKIPGTTAHHNDNGAPPLKGIGQPMNSRFVGGVSDKNDGIAVMEYNRDGLFARKSWFILNDKIYCLGSGIASTGMLPVTTSINQCYLNGKVVINKAGNEHISMEDESIHDPTWIVHDNIGYFFPNGGNIRIETKSVEGSWHRVASRYPDKKIYDRLFKLWFRHGINPRDNKYSYVLVPNATKKDMRHMELNPPFKILNDTSVQVVASADQSLAGVVFYKAGRIDLFGGIQVNQPCILLVRKDRSGLKICMTDPTQRLSSLRVTVEDRLQWFSGPQVFDIALPTGSEAGKTTMLYLSKSKQGKRGPATPDPFYNLVR